MRLRIGIGLGLLLAYLATGLAVVGQDEVGVVRRFGAVDGDPWEPGLHWGLPWGLGRVDLVKVGQARTLTVGAPGQNAAPLTRAPDPEGDDRLTGDRNLVAAEATLQYRVADPVAYLFAADSADSALALAAESALTRALARRGVDDVLTTGRAEVAEAIQAAIQLEADRAGLGVSIRAVRLGRVAPPVAVAPAFADADRARSDRRQAVTRAEEYRERAEADARGRSREIADRAAARVDRASRIARGEADRFSKVLAESSKAPDATRRRLYLELLAELLPRLGRKVVVGRGEAVDLSLIGDEGSAPTPTMKPKGEAGR
jgi:modulator of FtsH protease HflK